MKRLKIIASFIFIVMILCMTGTIYATDTDLKITGASTVEKGSTNTITVSIDSSNTIGVVSGVIEHSSGITGITVKESNSWTLTYNDSTGDFNIYKAAGSNNEAFMTITYTLSSDATGAQSITIKNLKTTTISYVTNSRDDMTYKINIGSTEEPNNTTDNNIVNENNSTTNDTTNDTTNNTTNNVSNTTVSNTNTTGGNNKPSSSSATSSDKTLPHTGKTSILIVLFIAGIISWTLYYRYTKYYKDI